jgi:hypothetical protein
MADETFLDMVCQNYINKKLIGTGLNIGYSHHRWPFIALPSLALLLNIFIILTHIRRKLHQRYKKNYMRNLFIILCII